MDSATRRYIRQQLDAHTRRVQVLETPEPARKFKRGSNARRWGDHEIKQAFLELTGGRKVTRGEYLRLRRGADPAKYPSYDTAKNRCADLFV